jgi:hypothetical protein
LADAVNLVQQGYSIAHAARVTGWAGPVIEAQLKISDAAHKPAPSSSGEECQKNEDPTVPRVKTVDKTRR